MSPVPSIEHLPLFHEDGPDHRTAGCIACGMQVPQPSRGRRYYCDDECRRRHEVGVVVTPTPEPLDHAVPDSLFADLADLEEIEALREEIARLPYRYRRVVQMLAGLGGRTYTRYEVASRFAVTPERVKHIEREAHAHLRRQLNPVHFA